MINDDKDPWPEPGGPEPHEWHWTPESHEMAEYVGLELYLQMRDRLSSLDVPASTHDLVLERLIDWHDLNYMNHGVACVTLITRSNGSSLLMDLDIVGPDEHPPMGPYGTGWAS